MYKYFILVFSCLSFMNCNHAEDFQTWIDFENQILSEFADDFDQFTVNLDEVETDTILLNSTDGLVSSGDLIIGQPVAYTKWGDDYVIADRSSDALILMDETGRVQNVGRRGFGPGEFGMITNVFSNDDYLFIADMARSRVHILNSDFSYVADITTIPFLRNYTSGSNSYLFVPSSPVDSSLVRVVHASPPFDQHDALLPKLIPPGYQPDSYNAYFISSNDELIATGYFGLPYVFVLSTEDLSPRYVLQVEYSKIHELDNPPVQPVPFTEGEGMRVRFAFTDVFINEDEEILFSHGYNLFMLSITNGQIDSVRSFVFKTPEGEWVTPGMNDLDQEHLYISSPHDTNIYKVARSRLD